MLANYPNRDDSSSLPNSLTHPFGQHLSTNTSRFGLNGAHINMSTYSGVSRSGGGGGGGGAGVGDSVSLNKDDGSGGSSSGNNPNSGTDTVNKSNTGSNIQVTTSEPNLQRSYTA